MICRACDFPQYYYQTIPAILLGAFWYKNRGVLDELLNRRWFVLTMAALFMSAVFLIKVAGKNGYVWLLAEGILFIPVLLAIIKRIRIDNAVTRYLGTISFEMYIFHGLFMILFRSNLLYISADYLYFAVVAAATVGCSHIAVLPVRKIYASFRKYA